MSEEHKHNIDLWFGLSCCSYMVLPRLALQYMPKEWQYKFVEMVNQIKEEFPDEEFCSEYLVKARENGKFIKDKHMDYRHGYLVGKSSKNGGINNAR